jgi:predicted subunit of tRNA(5-methylaminomethyl-2-thiouridylate) methyltransferase
VVLHSFKDAPSALAVPLPGSGWRIVDKLTLMAVSFEANVVTGVNKSDFEAQVVLLERGE